MKQSKKISRKVISIVLSLLMVFSCFSGMSLTAYAAETTVTWKASDITGKPRDKSFTKDGITFDFGNGSFVHKEFFDGGTFTTESGKFTKIEVTGDWIDISGTGWSQQPSYTSATWTGEASSSVSYSGDISGEDGQLKIVFTIEPADAPSTVDVTGVTLNPSTAQTIDVGGSVAFTATVAPDGATDKTVKWSVGGTNAGAVKLYSDADCKTEVGTGATETLTVYAKGIAAGSATVTVTTNDGNKTASCDVTVTAPTYTITWKSDANTVIDTTQVEEGATPTHAAPADYEDADYTYTFAGWTPEVVAATADATYTATFTATPKPAEPTSTVSFTKVTDASQITADNIGTCTADEATAWVQENWDAVYSNESFAYYAYYTETTGLNIGIIFPGVSKDYISNYIYTNREVDRDIEGLTYSLGRGEAVYLCTPAAPAPTTYTITWKSDANTLIDETQVEEGATPTHAAPANYEDADYTYTFAGWTPEVVAATADATYTATFTATPKPHNNVNLTLGEDITSNYYVDYSKYPGAQKIRYSYNCVNELEQNVQDGATIALDEIPDEMKDATSGRFVLEVSQAPAQMAEPTVIEILDGNNQVIDTLNYSAKTYCDTVLAMSDDELAQYTAKGAELRTLCHTLLAYGEAAQGVFADYETTEVTCESDAVIEQINNATATANHTVDNSGMIKFSGVSFVCTKDARLRFYLNTSEATSTPAAPTASTGNAALKYTLNGAEKQYFVEVSGINAADFNEQITVNYGGSTIKLSVLDFAGIVLRDGSGASAALQHFAKTLVVYNTNALAFFN